MSADEFFDTREDWSRRKHMILEHYLPPATAKLRSVSPDRRVILLDGFAGRGRYEDGTPGSPIHMGHLADKVRAWKDPVDLRIYNIEAKSENFAELETCTAEWVSQGIITNYESTFNKALQTVLTEAASSPLIAFLDPFKPKHLLFTDIVPLLTRVAKTEILIVFHTPSVLRIIEQVRPYKKTDEDTRKGSIQRLNAIFSGEHWQQFLTEQPTVEAVVHCFVDGLLNYSHLPQQELFICDTPIEARHGSNLKYHIIFMTRNRHGVFLMNDAFTKEKRDVHGRTATTTGISSLFDEYADPMHAPQRAMSARNTVLDAAQSIKGNSWPFEKLLLEAMTLKFGQFTKTDYKNAVRELLDSQNVPRLIGVRGAKLNSGKWKVDEGLMLRLED